MGEDNKLFNLNILRNLTIIFICFGLTICAVFDLNELLETKTFSEINFIYIRHWFQPPLEYDSLLYGIGVVLILAVLIINIVFIVKLREINQQREDPTGLRQMILTAQKYLILGRILELSYYILDTEFVRIREVIGSFYTSLDLVALIMFILMAYSVFIAGDTSKKSVSGRTIVIFSIISYIMAYIFLLLYGLFRDVFEAAVMLMGFVLIVNVLLAVVVLIQIVRLLKWVDKNKQAMIYTGIQILLWACSVVFLIGQGLTQEAAATEVNILPNKIIHFIRMCCLLIAGILCFPSFIKPARQKIEV